MVPSPLLPWVLISLHASSLICRPGFKNNGRAQQWGARVCVGELGELGRTGMHCCSHGFLLSGEGPKAHIRKLAECIRWSYGAGIVLRLGNIARLELNYCIPMGVQTGDRYVLGIIFHNHIPLSSNFILFWTWLISSVTFKLQDFKRNEIAK